MLTRDTGIASGAHRHGPCTRCRGWEETLPPHACTHVPPLGCVRGRCHSRPTPLPPLRSSREPRGCAPQRLEPHLASPLPPRAARSTRAAPGRPGIPGVAVHLVHVVGVRQATRAPRIYPRLRARPTRSGASRWASTFRFPNRSTSSGRAAPHRPHQPPAGGRPRREYRHVAGSKCPVSAAGQPCLFLLTLASAPNGTLPHYIADDGYYVRFLVAL